jgi:hypothetical protein
MINGFDIDVLFIVFVCWVGVMNCLWARHENNSDEVGSECDVEANHWQIQEMKRNVRDSKGRFVSWSNWS